MKKTIAVLAGDGVGPEVMAEALRVLHAVEKKFSHTFETREALIGGAAFDKFGTHFPPETAEICKNSDAILFGSVGGPVDKQHEPKWKGCEANSILALRKTFSLATNFRPVAVYSELKELSPLRPEIIERGIDILIVRELVGDVYFGEHKTETVNGKRRACDVAEYTEEQVATATHAAFKAARLRRKKVTSVDKANVLDTSKLWRAVVTEIHREYSDVTLEHMLVDNCAMQLVKDPSQFDVVVTSNLFGDILSDEAAVLCGSLGLLCSASLNAQGFGLYEPPGGSAQDIAGKGVANPVGQILSVALLLRHSFGLEKEAAAIENAVRNTLRIGLRTKDILQAGGKNSSAASTKEFADAVLKQLA